MLYIFWTQEKITSLKLIVNVKLSLSMKNKMLIILEKVTSHLDIFYSLC